MLDQDAEGNADTAGALEARARASRGTSGGVSHYAWAVRDLEHELSGGKAILDLGCGVGLFGTFLHDRFGGKAHGVDLIRHAGFCEENYASFTLRNLETLTASEHPFDLIFAIGLIEYLPDPRAFIRSLPKNLTARGKVVLTSPNPASLLNILSLLARGEFSAFRESSNPASISPVLAVDVCRMFREAGFATPAVDYSQRGRFPLFRGRLYQEIMPFLQGRLWSDDYRVIASLNQP